MNQSVTQRQRARIDLLEQFVYIGEESGVKMAERYFAAVNKTCALLVKQPRMGTAYDAGIPELEGLRRIPVRGFENYLVFYLPRPSGVDVIRVLHGARDIENLFEQEE